MATITCAKSVAIFKLHKALYVAGSYIISDSDTSVGVNAIYSTPNLTEFNSVLMTANIPGK
jgi:hypothetical protein